MVIGLPRRDNGITNKRKSLVIPFRSFKKKGKFTRKSQFGAFLPQTIKPFHGVKSVGKVVNLRFLGFAETLAGY